MTRVAAGGSEGKAMHVFAAAEVAEALRCCSPLASRRRQSPAEKLRRDAGGQHGYRGARWRDLCFDAPSARPWRRRVHRP